MDRAAQRPWNSRCYPDVIQHSIESDVAVGLKIYDNRPQRYISVYPM
jgi:hypothetical protein